MRNVRKTMQKVNLNINHLKSINPVKCKCGWEGNKLTPQGVCLKCLEGQNKPKISPKIKFKHDWKRA